VPCSRGVGTWGLTGCALSCSRQPSSSARGDPSESELALLLAACAHVVAVSFVRAPRGERRGVFLLRALWRRATKLRPGNIARTRAMTAAPNYSARTAYVPQPWRDIFVRNIGCTNILFFLLIARLVITCYAVGREHYK
jgi:hypothetical protein